MEVFEKLEKVFILQKLRKLNGFHNVTGSTNISECELQQRHKKCSIVLKHTKAKTKEGFQNIRHEREGTVYINVNAHRIIQDMNVRMNGKFHFHRRENFTQQQKALKRTNGKRAIRQCSSFIISFLFINDFDIISYMSITIFHITGLTSRVIG